MSQKEIFSAIEGNKYEFKIAYEADRVLMDLGHIVIYDFHPPFQCTNNILITKEYIAIK